jgi:thymidine kinase
MAKLFFFYGAMDASKTAAALMVAHNYKERGQKALLMKPFIDSRNGTLIKSRIGLEMESDLLIELDTDIFKFVKDSKKEDSRINCIIVDEVQFLKRQHIVHLCRVVEKLGIPVLCYGLRTDFTGNLFEGSQWLLAWADDIKEIKTMCRRCDRKATMNIRIDSNGERIYEGNQIKVGDNSSYISVCRKHFFS